MKKWGIFLFISLMLHILIFCYEQVPQTSFKEDPPQLFSVPSLKRQVASLKEIPKLETPQPFKNPEEIKFPPLKTPKPIETVKPLPSISSAESLKPISSQSVSSKALWEAVSEEVVQEHGAIEEPVQESVQEMPTPQEAALKERGEVRKLPSLRAPSNLLKRGYFPRKYSLKLRKKGEKYEIEEFKPLQDPLPFVDNILKKKLSQEISSYFKDETLEIILINIEFKE